MLSDTQIDSFFKETIEYPDWKEALNSNKLEFVKQLIQKYQYHSYFHNVQMSATSPDKRRTPTAEDIIKIGLEGTGGCCVHQNAFMSFLLKSIGFNAFMSSGNVVGSPLEGDGNHVMCILKLNDKEIYAIDVGVAQPVNEPIPLHNLPYYGIAGGFRYEYRYSETTSEYQRWQLDGAYFKGKYEDPNQEILRYKFCIEPKELSYFGGTLLDVFTNPANSIFLIIPFLFRSLDLEHDGKCGRRFILIFGASSVIYDDEKCNVKKFSSYKEMMPHILEYFPKISPELLNKSIDSFNNGSELISGDD